MLALPIDPLLPEIVAAVRAHGALVVVAPPGAGKTTRVPSALVDADLIPRGLVLVQPRRVAARAAARRIAAERGAQLGAEVGYQVRFDRQLTQRTRIKVVSEGILLRWLQDDPLLEGVDAVLLDELHLRSLELDLALALAREARRARPELRLVIMSATIDPAPVAAFVGGCPVLRAEARTHPVELVYEPRRDERPVWERTARAVRVALSEVAAGDVLVFLPGAREIRRTAEALGALPGADVLALHGSQPAEEQDRALTADPRARRRVVLATNVAETSLTIPGVTAVVDSGLVRLPRHDPRLGIDRLEVCRISLESAAQRAGRAGRTAPGRVYRLWTRAAEHGMSARTAPEVRRAELTTAVLQLRAWGADPMDFGWFEAPEAAVIERAERLLRQLGTLAADGKLTPLGRAVLGLPLHPRLGCLLVEAHRCGALHEGAGLAALLSDRDIVRRSPLAAGHGDARRVAASDIVERLEWLEEARRGGFRGWERDGWQLDGAAARAASVAQQELARIGERLLGPVRRRGAPGEEDLLRLLLVAFPDRVARRREGDDGHRPRAVMVGGRGLVLGAQSMVRGAELFVAVAIEDRGGADAEVTLASAIPRAALKTRCERELRFDERQRRVVSVERLLYEDLCLEEKPVPAEGDEVAAVLAAAAARRLGEALGRDADTERWLARVRWLRAQLPELGLPAFDDAELVALLPALCAGKRSFADLRREPLLPHLAAALSGAQRAALARCAPETLRVPSGAAIRLRYEVEGPPVLSVQLQQLFGLADTPALVDGRVPVRVELLAPSQRPVQVTQDLRSFWEVAYPQVRQQLMRRYPKHAWPEDPWTAPPQRRPGGKRRR